MKPPTQTLRPNLFVNENKFGSPTVATVVTKRMLQKHWGWIATYVGFQLLALIPTYFFQDWMSVGFALLVAVIGTAIGLKIVTQVIVETREVTITRNQ